MDEGLRMEKFVIAANGRYKREREIRSCELVRKLSCIKHDKYFRCSFLFGKYTLSSSSCHVSDLIAISLRSLSSTSCHSAGLQLLIGANSNYHIHNTYIHTFCFVFCIPRSLKSMCCNQSIAVLNFTIRMKSTIKSIQ